MKPLKPAVRKSIAARNAKMNRIFCREHLSPEAYKVKVLKAKDSIGESSSFII